MSAKTPINARPPKDRRPDSALDQLIVQSFDPEHLELIILPTEQCNFRCTYCYEDFIHGKMPRRVVDALKALLKVRAADLRSLHLSWFGGEPLLAKDIILEINEFARGAYAGKLYHSNITTNGSLMDYATFSSLVRSGLRYYQISLDGFKEIHDISRRTAGGRGTFDVIWNNLLQTRMSSEDFSITLRVHVSHANADLIDDFLDHLLLEFSGDPRYNIFLKEIVKLGGQNDSEIIALSKDRMATLVSSLKVKCEGRIEVEHDDGWNPHVCYASRLNSFLIRSDGRIGKCTVALRDDDNIVGLLNEDGSVAHDRKKLLLWTGGLFTGEKDRLGCPLGYKIRNSETLQQPITLIN